MQKHIIPTIIVSLALGAGTMYFLVPTIKQPALAKNEKQCFLKTAMRKLWADHVVWTRDYIIAATTQSPEVPVATQRLLKNQDDIGNAIAPFYGSQAGTQLTKLLKEHILIAADLIAAAMIDDKAKYKAIDNKWHANAQDIAAFLSSANPYWPKDALVNMLNDHLALTTQEVVARISKKWADDVTAFDKVFNQAMMMADDLTAGIIKQFPEKF